MKTRILAILVIVAMLMPGIATPAAAATQAEIDLAIQNGLAWLATQQNPDGSFGSGPNPAAYTAAAVLAFENEGHFPGGGTLYSANVEFGLDFIFGYAQIGAIGVQPAGDPDSDGDGLGVSFYDEGITREVYETGMVMQAIIASNTPNRIVTTGPCAGWTYRDVMVDIVDWAAFGQVDAGTGRGGWRYYANYVDSDNSTAQWPVLGLVAAEQWGIFAPQWVKDELNIWIDYIQNDVNGGSGYDSPTNLVNVAKTGGLLIEMFYVGDDKNTTRAQAALGYINANWAGVPSGWDGNKGHPYAMFSVFKGLELLGVTTIPNALASPETPAGDWYGDYAEGLVNAQNINGSWSGYSSWNAWLSTGWYIVILQATVFPVTVTIDVPECACDTAGYDVTVDYSVERFPANGSLDVYEDDVLFATVSLVDFQGNATATFPVASDTPGPHTWKAVLSVTGGGISVVAEDTDTLIVCETPQVAGIPDQTAPFQTFDLDDYLTYSGDLAVMWSISGVPATWTVTIDADNVVTVMAPEGAMDPADLTFTASVACSSSVTCSDDDVATFIPNQPPDCTQAYPSIATIWPPNHQFVPIGVMGVTDPDGDVLTITVDSIFQDEPVDTYGDGRFTPDGLGVGTSTAEVRAERAGTKKVPGNGRVYHIAFSADDGRGGLCTGEIMVGVPHDQSGAPAVDGGALYDSTQLAP